MLIPSVALYQDTLSTVLLLPGEDDKVKSGYAPSMGILTQVADTL